MNKPDKKEAYSIRLVIDDNHVMLITNNFVSFEYTTQPLHFNTL